jgi:putative ABC transport system ATP-binding protein
MPPVLTVEHVERHLFDGERRTEVAIDSVALMAGTVHCLCGPSGTGKTTALEMLSLAARPDVTGAMRLTACGDMIELHKLVADGDQAAMARVRAVHFGYVVQTSRLLPYLTVRENIELAQAIAGRIDRAVVENLMGRLQILPLANARAADLSGGQRQRVSVARALAHSPSVVLADEPTSAVDQLLASTIMSVILDHVRGSEATALVITHNSALAAAFGLSLLTLETRSVGNTMRTTIGPASAAGGSPGKLETAGR